MKIVNRKIKDLKPAAYNPRKISDKQLSDLKESIETFGEMEPAIININEKRKNIIVSGHQRLKAAEALGYKEWPCIQVDLSLKKEKELNVRMNKNTGEWDFEMLKNEFEIEDLESWGFDDLQFMDDLEGGVEGLTDEDDVPEQPEAPRTKPGDLYVLGKHRLLCGDSTKKEDVERLMDGEKADMVFTDPPYRISFEGQRLSNTTVEGVKKLGHKGANNRHDKIANDSLPESAFSEFLKSVLQNIKYVNDGAWYICFAYTELHLLLNALIAADLKWKNILIWMKNQATLSSMDYKSRYEPIVYGQPGGKFYGKRYQQEDIWEFQRTLKNDLHPTMKPVPLVENALENSSKKDGLVLDLFAGSGSTLIACENTGRKARAMELDPGYCDVIVKR